MLGNLHPFRSFADLGLHNHPLDKIAELNGLLSGLALFPQVFKALTTQNTSGLSLFTFVFIFLNSLIWILYARHRELPQLLLSSALNTLSSGILLGYMIFF